MDLEKILKVAVRGGASDVILKTGAMPRFRFNGELVTLADGQAITAQIMQNWIEKVLPQHLHKRLTTAGDADFAYQSQGGNRFRVNLFRQRQSYGMVLRVITTAIRTIEELQLPPILRRLAEERRGLILVTGATGSGKSTTLAALLQKINLERAAHIITIEDPIEFNFKDEKATVNQREIGIDSESFSSALRAALRQNPDIIFVGELRDRETTETALSAAETGHLVLSTLHTSDAVESLTRLLSYFEPHKHANVRQMLAQSLRAVLSQRLVTRRDGKGLVAALEVMMVNATVREAILKSDHFTSLYNVIASGGDQYGMQSFDQALLELYHQGIISRDVALSQATHRADLELKIRGVGA
jgi:twitching motility protein PilT